MKVNTIKLCYFLFSGLMLSGLTGCQNFLNGDDLKTQLSSEIEHANAPGMEIEIQADSGAGIMNPTGKLFVKKDDTIDLRFDPSDAYAFDKFVCLDSKGNISSCIDFGKNDNTNIEAVVKSLGDKLTIKPLCYKRPVITKVTPMGEGYIDNSIYIYFDQPIDKKCLVITAKDLSDFGLQNSGIYNPIRDDDGNIVSCTDEYNCKRYFKTIDITSAAGVSLNDCYNPPYLDMDNTRLVIETNKSSFPYGYDPKTIRVTVKKNIFSKENEIAALLQNYVFEFSTNGKCDNLPPDIISFEIHETRRSSEQHSTVLYDNESSLDNSDIYCEENTLSSFTFDLTAYDLESGVAGLEITETLLRDPYGNSTFQEHTEYIYSGYRQEDDLYIWENCKYDFKIKEDGVVRITFGVVDKAGNKFTDDYNDYLFVKDSDNDLCDIRVYNLRNTGSDIYAESDTENNGVYGADLITNESVEDNIESINEKLKNISVVLREPVYTLNNQTVYKELKDYESIVLYYGSNPDTLKKIDLTRIEPVQETYYDSVSKKRNIYEGSLKFNVKIDEISKTSDTLLKLEVKNKSNKVNAVWHAIPKMSELPYYFNYKENNEGDGILNKYFEFMFQSDSLDKEKYSNYYDQSKINLYSYKNSGMNSKLLYSSNKLDHNDYMYTYTENINDCPKISNLSEANDYYYYPMSFYMYKNNYVGENAGNERDNYNFYFLAGPVSLEKSLKVNIKNSNFEATAEDFKNFSYEVTNDFNLRCFKLNVALPENNDTYEYSFSLKYGGYSPKQENYESSKVLYFENEKDGVSLIYNIYNKITKKTASSEPIVLDFSCKEVDGRFTAFKKPQIRTSDKFRFGPGGQEFVVGMPVSYYGELKEFTYKFYSYDSKWNEFVTYENYTPVIDENDSVLFSGKINKFNKLSDSEQNYYYKWLRIPAAGLTDGVYTLGGCLTDENYNEKNEGLFTFRLMTIEKSNLSAAYENKKVSVIFNNSSTYFSEKDSNRKANRNYISVYEFDKNEKKWKPAFSDPYETDDEDYYGLTDFDYYKMQKVDGQDKYIFEKSLTVDQPKWLKIQYMSESTNQLFKYRIPPHYIYTDSSSSSSALCRVEKITDLTFLASCDMPFIVETIQSPVNLGDDIDAWDLYGEVAYSESFEPGSHWYYTRNNEITDRYYFVHRLLMANGGETKTEVMNY